MAAYLRPEDAHFTLTTRYKGALKTPTAMLITIKEEDGSTVIDEATMTEDTEGRIYYDYDTDGVGAGADAADGDYKIIYKTTYGSKIRMSTDSFTVDTP